jgi:hypothetical protein
MVSGETHHIWGIGHRLIVVEGAASGRSKSEATGA